MPKKKLQIYRSFWQFSLEVYGQDSVQKNCLSLQNEYGLNVNLMLTALWAAAWQQKIGLEDFNYFQNKLKDFDTKIIKSLREVRRAVVDNFYFEFEEAPKEIKILKEQLLSVEIEAEKIYQQQLEFMVLNSFQEIKNRMHSEDFKIDLERFAVIGKENLNSYLGAHSQQSAHAISSPELLSQIDCLLNSVVN